MKQRILCLVALAIIVIGASVSLYRLGLGFEPPKETPVIKTITPPKLPEALKGPTAPNIGVKSVSIPPIMAKIAMCESQDHQFNPNGTVKRGKVNHHDIGYLQINSVYWGGQAVKQGYDIYTLRGNLDMGLWIYKHYGTKPWSWSENCWK